MLEKIENETFQGQTLQLDGKHFNNCHFVRCILQYAGNAVVQLKKDSFAECTFVFIDSARRTMQFISGLYQSGAKQLFEDIFEDIRRGKFISR